MKKICFGFLGLLIWTAVPAQKAPEKTIEDLKVALNGESTARAKYAKYAEIARTEGYINIARIFEATSKAESIHAKNHQAVLEKLGIKGVIPAIGPFTPGKTEENLADGIKGETWEYESMYPPMIKEAEAREIFDAVISLRYARDTEKKHRVIYEKALTAFKTDKGKTLPVIWYVCPTCGNTYSTEDLPVSCEFCGTLRPRFIIFQ